LYGLLDTTIRYTTNENAKGDNKFQLTDGVLTGSRWGMRGIEDLGGGTKAVFQLESGFGPDNGTSLQGGRLFGRHAWMGLQSGMGTLTFGRQYTIIHDVIASYESMALANLAIVGFQGGNYTGGVRQDNMVKYSGTFGPVTVAAQHAFGETAGSFSKSSSTGGSLAYATGPLRVAGGYQVIRDVTTYYGIATPGSNQKVWTLGGTYLIGQSTVYAGYTNSKVDTADYKNQAFYLGVNVPFTRAVSLIATATYDKLKHAGTKGNRFTGSAMLDYAFSKRTDVYVEVDYTKLSDAWTTLGAQPTFQTPFFGKDSRLGAMVGLRHKF
jgi:predicted porin